MVFELISQLAGLLTIAAAVYLFRMQKNYVNENGDAVIQTEINLKFIGKMKTNSPAFAFAFLGFILIKYPPLPNQTHYFTVKKELDAGLPSGLVAYAAATQTIVGSTNHLRVLFPDLSAPYQPLLLLDFKCGLPPMVYPIVRDKGQDEVTLTAQVQTPPGCEKDLTQQGTSFKPDLTGDSSGYKGISQ